MSDVITMTEPLPQILVCDDNDQYAWALRYNFRNDFDVHLAPNTDDALVFLKSKPVDILMLDIEMRTPREGLEALPKIREISPHIGIIMMSGHTDLPSVREAFKHGVVDFLSKDASADEIRFVVNQVLAKRRDKIALFDSREEFEKNRIVDALRKTNGNISQAAELLNMDRTWLGRKMKKLGIES